MHQDNTHSSQRDYMIWQHRYSIMVRDLNADIWHRFFSSNTLDCAQSMLLYLDRRMYEALRLEHDIVTSLHDHHLN